MNWRISTSFRLCGIPQRKNSAVTRKKATMSLRAKRGCSVPEDGFADTKFMPIQGSYLHIGWCRPFVSNRSRTARVFSAADDAHRQSVYRLAPARTPEESPVYC